MKPSVENGSDKAKEKQDELDEVTVFDKDDGKEQLGPEDANLIITSPETEEKTAAAFTPPTPPPPPELPDRVEQTADGDEDFKQNSPNTAEVPIFTTVNDLPEPEPKQLEEEIKQKPVGSAGVTEQDYYHGLLPREDIKTLLNSAGDFLLRNTELVSGQKRMCVSVKPEDGSLQHFVVAERDGKYMIQESDAFDSVTDLVNHYMKEQVKFGTPAVQLTNPVCRQDWEYSADQVECVKEIGGGAFGQVYFGKIRPRGAPCHIDAAIKTMKASMMTKGRIEEIMREARLMRMLRHRNIVRCYGVSADQEPLMILMEYVQGGSLDTYLRKETVRIQVEERVQMCLDASAGLANIHQCGIIHRDVAARNCLYGNKVLKISDFGLSRQARSIKILPTERMPVRSLAPEVFRTREYTRPADVWAFGVLLFEIFTNGSTPYHGWNGAVIKEEVRKGYRLTLPSWAPRYIKEVMAECFREDPKKRARLYIIHMLLKNIKTVRIKAQAKANQSKGVGGQPIDAEKLKRSKEESMEQLRRTMAATLSKTSRNKHRSVDGTHRSSEVHRAGESAANSRNKSKTASARKRSGRTNATTTTTSVDASVSTDLTSGPPPERRRHSKEHSRDERKSKPKSVEVSVNKSVSSNSRKRRNRSKQKT